MILTKRQTEHVHYRWFHVFAALMTVAIGLAECSLTSHLWSSLPQGKLFLLLLLLLGCVGNSWRAYQGWQLKALLGHHQAKMPPP